MTVMADIDIDEDEVAGDAPKRTRRRDGSDNARATRSRAAQRAIDRRAKRLEREARVSPKTVRSPRSHPASARGSVSLRDRITGVPFVVPVIALLVIGLGVSLWLSTKAAADSYRLGIERQQNQTLLDRRDSLKRTYESGNSAPELSDKASRLGMIPAQNPARMIVTGTGKPRVVGDPEPAQGKALRSINPPTSPDPVATIDPKKVDDSEGLPGDAVDSGDESDSAGTDSADTGSGDNSDSANPGATTPASTATPAPAPGSSGAPVPSVVAPAPNVLPPTGNAPSPNSAESR